MNPLQLQDESNTFPRSQFLDKVKQIHFSTLQHIQLLFQNFPPEVLSKKIPLDKEKHLIHQLPGLLHAAHATLTVPSMVLMRTQDHTANERDKKDIKAALETIILVQETLRGIKDSCGAEIHEPARRSNRASWERHIDYSREFPDITIGHKDPSGRFALNGSDQKLLDLIIEDITYYTIAQAHLLGVSLKGTSLDEVECDQFKLHHSALPPLRDIAPPPPWAQAIKPIMLSLPTKETNSFYGIG